MAINEPTFERGHSTRCLSMNKNFRNRQLFVNKHCHTERSIANQCISKHIRDAEVAVSVTGQRWMVPGIQTNQGK